MLTAVHDDKAITGLTRSELIALIRTLENERGRLVAALLDGYATLAPDRVGVLLPETIETIREIQ